MKKYCLDGEIASFDFHDESGLWSFCGPKSLNAFLAELKSGEKATIEINSPGGSVVAGVEMANAIKNSGAHLIAHVTGIAASMASVVACACDEIVMEEASFMMIHDPWGEIEGNADEMRKEAKLLDQMKAVIMSFYRGKFEGKSDEELSALMSDETWYTGGECLANGLKCTVVKSDVKIAAKVGARNFAKMPDAVKALYAFGEMPEAVRSAVEAAAHDAEGSAADAGETSTATEPQAPTEGAPAAKAEPISEPVASEGKDTKPADDWEARFKGLSRKFNELQDKFVNVADTAKALAEKQDAEIENLKSQVEQRVKDLAEANAKVSELSGQLEEKAKALEEAGKELAEARDGLSRANEQVERLKTTRDVLTAGVLSVPSEPTLSYDEAMRKAQTVNEREKLRAQKKAGKIK